MNKDRDTTSDNDALKGIVEDVLNVVSKTGNKNMISGLSPYDVESEDIKKAWFRHMLSSMEKLNALVETVRSVDFTNLKNDLREEIRKVESRLDRLEQQVRDNRQELLTKIDKVDTELIQKIDRSHQDLLKRIDDVTRDLQSYKVVVDTKFNQFDKDIEEYRRVVIDPLRLKIMAVSVKLGVWGTIAGLVGSALFTVAWYLIKTYALKG